VKESTLQREREAITPPLVQRSVNKSRKNRRSTATESNNDTQQIFVNKSYIRNMTDKDTTTGVETDMS